MWGDWRDTYRYGTLVIWPPDAVRAVVNVLRQHYDPASAAVCEAHVTLTQPFIDAPSSGDLDLVRDIVERFQPLDIRYGPIDTFLPYPCVFFAIEPAEPLLALHDVLQATGLFHPFPEHIDRFVPHMTILENTLAPDATALLASGLQRTTTAGSFVLEDIAHIVPDAAFRFSVERRFGFRRSSL